MEIIVNALLSQGRARPGLLPSSASLPLPPTWRPPVAGGLHLIPLHSLSSHYVAPHS